MRRVVAALLVVGVVFAPTASAEPQCWDSYSQRQLERCGGDPNAPGGFPGAGGGGQSDGGGLIGVIKRGLKRLL